MVLTHKSEYKLYIPYQNKTTGKKKDDYRQAANKNEANFLNVINPFVIGSNFKYLFYRRNNNHPVTSITRTSGFPY